MRHTCNEGRGPAFGRKTPGCPRCNELLAGAAPVKWAGTQRREDEAQRSRDLSAHFASTRHRSGGCGPVCTFGDW
jgi:hypothetical protein